MSFFVFGKGPGGEEQPFDCVLFAARSGRGHENKRLQLLHSARLRFMNKISALSSRGSGCEVWTRQSRPSFSLLRERAPLPLNSLLGVERQKGCKHSAPLLSPPALARPPDSTGRSDIAQTFALIVIGREERARCVGSSSKKFLPPTPLSPRSRKSMEGAACSVGGGE